MTTDDLFSSLIQGKEQLWEISNNGVFKGWATTDFLIYPNAKIIARITTLVCEDWVALHEEALEFFESWAKEIGACGIEIWGRKGFNKFLKRLDYEMTQQLYVKRFSDGQ